MVDLKDLESHKEMHMSREAFVTELEGISASTAFNLDLSGLSRIVCDFAKDSITHMPLLRNVLNRVDLDSIEVLDLSIEESSVYDSNACSISEAVLDTNASVEMKTHDFTELIVVVAGRITITYGEGFSEDYGQESIVTIGAGVEHSLSCDAPAVIVVIRVPAEK
jgi:quercetin dioxygenase-like cupin family protein